MNIHLMQLLLFFLACSLYGPAIMPRHLITWSYSCANNVCSFLNAFGKTLKSVSTYFSHSLLYRKLSRSNCIKHGGWHTSSVPSWFNYFGNRGTKLILLFVCLR